MGRMTSHYIMEHQKCLKPPTSWYIDDYYPIILWNVKKGLKPPTSWYIDDYYPIILWNIKNVWNHQPADILMTIIPLYYGTSKMFETTNQLLFISPTEQCSKPTCCPFWSWLVNRIPRKNGWLRWSSPSEIASKSRYSNKVVSPLLQQLWFIGDVSMSMSDGLYRLKKHNWAGTTL